MPNADHSIPEEEGVVSLTDGYLNTLREKILFGLSIYKFVSPTMLHTFLGTSTPSSLWKEKVLAELLASGEVVQSTVSMTSPFDRSQSYTILHLPENAYIPPESALNPNGETSEPRATPEEPATAVA